MKTENIILFGAIGLVAYLILKNKSTEEPLKEQAPLIDYVYNPTVKASPETTQTAISTTAKKKSNSSSSKVSAMPLTVGDIFENSMNLDTFVRKNATPSILNLSAVQLGELATSVAKKAGY